MSKPKAQAYEARIDENRVIIGKPMDGGICYRIKNGGMVTEILLSIEAVAAMFKIMNSIETDKEPRKCSDCKHSFVNPFDQRYCDIRDERNGEVWKACGKFEARKGGKA